ncbi:hypothetical protein HAX54_029412, partial [Datura stramonium]|nr:hypothetical protein [Datura stramonium]
SQERGSSGFFLSPSTCGQIVYPESAASSSLSLQILPELNMVLGYGGNCPRNPSRSVSVALNDAPTGGGLGNPPNNSLMAAISVSIRSNGPIDLEGWASLPLNPSLLSSFELTFYLLCSPSWCNFFP